MKEFIRSIIVSIITLEAKAVLKKYKPHIIVVTGSVGKTSTKDAAYTALRKSAFVRKSEKSFNSDIGVPLTILGCPNGWGSAVQWAKNILDGLLLLAVVMPYPRWLVVEVGADRPGDISRALSWLEPRVVVTTRFPEVPVHVEFYDSPEAVVREEAFPLTRLPEGGVAVCNKDDEALLSQYVPGHARLLTYGFAKGADVRGTRFKTLSTQGVPNGISFDVAYGEEKERVTLKDALGAGHALSVLAGIASALATGAPLAEAVQQFEAHTTPPGRLRIIPGVHGATLIDDSYNSSPVATEEALRVLKDVPRRGKRIAVLSDMLELGSFSAGEHERLGASAADCADVLVTVGVRAKGFAEGAFKKGMPESAVHVAERGADAASLVLSLLEEGDVVLIKGSQSMRMERVVKSLMHTPERAGELLPRQDAEWVAR